MVRELLFVPLACHDQGTMAETRKLAAILAADIAGYSALMGSDEARTVRDLKGHQAVVLPMVGDFSGGIIDTAGDGILAEFASVVNAVECAVAIQRIMAERNSAIGPERRMLFRIGVNIGDVISDEGRIYLLLLATRPLHIEARRRELPTWGESLVFARALDSRKYRRAQGYRKFVRSGRCFGRQADADDVPV